MSKSKSKFDAVLKQKREPEAGALPEEQPKPKGKRNNPAFTQVTAYIPRTLHEEVKISLIREGSQDFSTLVENLLAEWVQTQRQKGYS